MEGTPQKKEDVKPTVLTNDEQALANRVAGSSAEWQTINEREVEDFSLSEDPFKLPEPAKKLQDEKKFKFRWFSRNPQRVDEVKNFAKVRRWWVVNRVQPMVGAFDDFVDGSTGGIHCLDQLLFFKPWWLWEAEQKVDRRLAEADMGVIENKDGEDAGDLKWAAGKRKLHDKTMGRQEVAGSDIHFRGEADVDADMGRGERPVTEGDLTTQE
jgi:hypothetical protein